MKQLLEEIYYVNRGVKKFIILLLDSALFIIASYLATSVQLEYLPPIGKSLMFYNLVSIFIYFFVFYRNSNIINRYFDLKSFNQIVISLLFLGIILYIIGQISNIRYFRLNFIVFQLLIFLLLLSLSRISIRNFFLVLRRVNIKTEACAIFGTGDSAYELINNSDFNEKYNVTHFVDEDKNKIGQYLRNKRIISLKDLKNYNFKKCFFCAPSLSSFKQKEILSIFTRGKIPLDFSYNINPFRKNSPQDKYNLEFKKNSNVQKHSQKFKLNYKNKVIFITGGAGSIGSEICSQLYNLNPKKIIVIDNNEFNLANLKRSLMLLKNNKIVRPYLVDVSNYLSLKELFYKFKPDFVFHAAAYKHVDIVEENSNFSIKNNILGINNVLKLTRDVKTSNFIFVSTDKAVRPKNIMGQTKKAGEIITTFYSRFKKKNLNYNSVRFGNVIGSSGSFMQILKKQLVDGGPITITSKKATRFFMTINDAVSLVIQAPFLGESGNTFVLKMGDPINIYQMVLDLIKKNKLKVKNKNELGDVEIKIIGLRDGEKVHEELFETNKNVSKTENPVVLVEKNNSLLKIKNLDLFISKIENIGNLKEILKNFLKINK
jgi:FlaA1/EpsC-like NDP-sugar epimerase